MNPFRIFFLMVTVICSAASGSETLDPNDPRWKWMDEQIDQEFSPYQKTGITKEMLNQTLSNTAKISFGNHLHHFKIIDGKVYGSSSAHHNAKGLLEKVAELYPVPDVEIILFTHDVIWNPWELSSPVFVTSQGHQGQMLIHFPIQHWDTWEQLIPTIEEAYANSPWDLKREKICWRGSPFGLDHLKDVTTWTQFERGIICTLTKCNPSEINAYFSGMPDWMFLLPNRKRYSKRYFL